VLEGTNDSWTKSLQVIENVVIFLPMTIAQWILNNFSLAGTFYSKLTAVIYSETTKWNIKDSSLEITIAKSILYLGHFLAGLLTTLS